MIKKKDNSANKENKYSTAFSAGSLPLKEAEAIIICRPKKNHLLIEIKLPKSDEVSNLIESSELDEMDYDNGWGAYRIRLNKGEISKREEVIKALLEKAEQNYNR